MNWYKIAYVDNVPSVLYHATYSPHLSSINKYGLVGSLSSNYSDSKDVIYLANDPYTAESYAETSDTVPEDWLDEIVILEIDTRGLDEDKIFIDRNNLENDTFEYHGIVDPSYIKKWM